MRAALTFVATWRLLLISTAVVAALLLVAWSFRGWHDEGITRVEDGRPLVALTFDDGVNGQYTLDIAAELERHGVQGTFFVVGRTLREQPEVAARLVQGGHLLANHTEAHERASTRDVWYGTLGRAQAAIRSAIGECPAYFRPPFGAETAFTKAAVRRAGLRTVLWDVEVGDWLETDPQRLASNVLAEVRPGSIVLLHDGGDGRPGTDRSTMVRALPEILSGLEARGLRAVRVDTLRGERGYLEAC